MGKAHSRGWCFVVVEHTNRHGQPQIAGGFDAQHLSHTQPHINTEGERKAQGDVAAGAGNIVRVADGFHHSVVVCLLHRHFGLVEQRYVKSAAGTGLDSPVPGKGNRANHNEGRVGMVIFADNRHENAAAGHLHTGVFVVAAQEAEHGADKDRLARVTPGALLFGTAGHFIGGGKAFFQLVQLVIHQVLQTLHLVPGFVLLPGRGGAVDEVDQILGLRCQRSAHKVGAVGQNHHRNRNRGNLHANLEVFLSGNGGGNLGAVLEGGQRKFILGIGGLRADGPLHRHSQFFGKTGIGETDLHGVTGFEQVCGGAAPGGGHGKGQGFGVLFTAQKAGVLLVELLLCDSLADSPIRSVVDCNQLHVGCHILGPRGAFIDAAKHDRKGHLGAEVDQIQTGFVIQQVCARQIHAAQIIFGIANRLQLNGLHGAAGQLCVQQGAGAVAVILHVHHAITGFFAGFENHYAVGAVNWFPGGIFLGCGHAGG